LRAFMFLFGSTALSFLVMLHGKKRRETGSVPVTRGKSKMKPVSAAAKQDFSTEQDPNAVLRAPVRGKPLSEMKRLQMPYTYNLSTVPGYEFLAGCAAFAQAPKQLPVNGMRLSHAGKGAFDEGQSPSGQRGSSRWPASMGDNQEALLEDPYFGTGMKIEAGTELTCWMNGFVFEQGLVHLGEDAVIGLLKEGVNCVASGPPELESGFVMVPIEPCGCVDVSIFVPKQGAAAPVPALEEAKFDQDVQKAHPEEHSEHASLLDNPGPEPAVLGMHYDENGPHAKDDEGITDQTSTSSAGSHVKASGHARSPTRGHHAKTTHSHDKSDDHTKKSMTASHATASRAPAPKIAAKKTDKSRGHPRKQSPDHTQSPQGSAG